MRINGEGRRTIIGHHVPECCYEKNGGHNFLPSHKDYSKLHEPGTRIRIYVCSKCFQQRAVPLNR